MENVPSPRPDRRRLARLVALLLIGGGAFLFLRSWHGRALEIELVHRFPDGNQHLPAEIEIQVWKADDLLADAYFPQPESILALEHSVRVPPGDYNVTFTLMHTYGEPELRFERDLRVEEAGRYYLDYR